MSRPKSRGNTRRLHVDPRSTVDLASDTVAGRWPQLSRNPDAHGFLDPISSHSHFRFGQPLGDAERFRDFRNSEIKRRPSAHPVVILVRDDPTSEPHRAIDVESADAQYLRTDERCVCAVGPSDKDAIGELIKLKRQVVESEILSEGGMNRAMTVVESGDDSHQAYDGLSSCKPR